MLKLITITILILLSHNLPAFELEKEDNTLIISGLSYHLDRSTDYNEVHDGIGIEQNYKGNHSLGFGYYDDSYHALQLYFSYRKTYQFNDYVSFGASALLITHTQYKDGKKWVPMAQPFVKLGYKRVNVMVSFVPALVEKASSVITAQLMLDF